MSRVMAVDIGASSYRVIEGTYREGRLAMKVLARYKHGPILEGGRYHWDMYGMARNMAEVIRQAAMKGEPVLSIGFDSFGTDFASDESGILSRTSRWLTGIVSATACMRNTSGKRNDATLR